MESVFPCEPIIEELAPKERVRWVLLLFRLNEGSFVCEDAWPPDVPVTAGERQTVDQCPNFPQLWHFELHAGHFFSNLEWPFLSQAEQTDRAAELQKSRG
ncbi:MAG: hypothetical protein GY799_00610 [Desulfobulbaceae bacterium]|nr:hypothetical protein [Desulfobulbaceae bacterium]